MKKDNEFEGGEVNDKRTVIRRGPLLWADDDVTDEDVAPDAEQPAWLAGLVCECGGAIVLGKSPTKVPHYRCEGDGCGAAWLIDDLRKYEPKPDRRTEGCHHHKNVECQYCEKTQAKTTTTAASGFWIASPMQGWQCPQCNTIYAPFVTHCSECKPRRNYEVFGPHARFTEAQFEMTTTKGNA